MRFELNRLARKCSNDEIIAEVKRVAALIKDEVISKDIFDKYAKVSSDTARRRLGSWKKVLIAAGLEHRYADRPEFGKPRNRKFTDEELIIQVQRIAKLKGKEHVTMEEFVKNSSIQIHPKSVRRRFGSWADLMKKANLKPSPNYHRRHSNDEYFENLFNVWTYHGRQPLYREIDKAPSTISSGAYENRFGSWRKAIEAFVIKMNEDKIENNEETDTDKTVPRYTELLKAKKEPNQKMIIPKAADHRGISLSLRYKY